MTHDDALPALPEWTKQDDLGGLVPSEIRQAMVAYARQAVALWKLSAMAQEDERAALAARAEPSRCPHIRSSGTGEWATNWCALNPPAIPSGAREAMIDAMCHAETYTPSKPNGEAYTQREYMALLLDAALRSALGQEGG